MITNVYTFAFVCFTRILTVESSFRQWSNLHSVIHGRSNNNSDFQGGQTVQSLTSNASPYPANVNTNRTASMILHSDQYGEPATTAFSTVSMTVPKIDSQIYVRWLGSDNFTQTEEAVAIVNRATFSSENDRISWKLVKNNETNIQVSLYPAIANVLPNDTKIQVDFSPVIKNVLSSSSFCGVLNKSCAPIVEINAQQSYKQIIIRDEKPIVEIKFNRTELNSFYGSIYNRTELNSYYGSIFKCVYWQEKDSAWENDGLETDNSDTDFVICHSTHLITQFSVLPDRDIGYQSLIWAPIPENHRTILVILRLGGSFVSIICVLITMASYCYLFRRHVVVKTNDVALKQRLKRQSTSISTKIFLHSCMALLLMHLSLQTYFWFGNHINCRVINFLTHYTVNTFAMWAAFDGLFMWRMLFKDIFNKRGPCIYRTCCIVSWGFPLLTMATGVFKTNYAADKCQLSFNKQYQFALYALPRLIMLGSNLLLFVWVMGKFICKQRLKFLHDKKVQNVLVLVHGFNLVWCLSTPLAWFPETRLLRHYLAGILFCVQGIIMVTLRTAKEFELKFILNFIMPSFLTSNSTKTTSNSASKSYQLRQSTSRVSCSFEQQERAI